MDALKRIAVLENQVEAGALSSQLADKEIPHIMRSYHDAALDGIFQAQKGWGCVEAGESDEAAVLAILDEIRQEAGREA